jgi:hypothetical protein
MGSADAHQQPVDGHVLMAYRKSVRYVTFGNLARRAETFPHVHGYAARFRTRTGKLFKPRNMIMLLLRSS